MASLHLAADQLVEETQTDAAGIGVTPRLEERPSADSAKKWFGVTIVRPPSYLTSWVPDTTTIVPGSRSGSHELVSPPPRIRRFKTPPTPAVDPTSSG